MKRKMERFYYPYIADFLLRRFGCFTTAINKGTKYGRLDVVGIRDVGGDLAGNFELIGVEVKRGLDPYNTAVGQAYGYSVYANRCYLADVRHESPAFSIEETDIASHLGVGLLAIGKRNVVREYLAAPIRNALESMRMHMADNICYVKCVCCGALFERGTPDVWHKHVSRSLKKAIKEEKGFVFWNSEAGVRKQGKRSDYYERRYVCPDCTYNLYRPLLNVDDDE